jgi:hypothetical protein
MAIIVVSTIATIATLSQPVVAPTIAVALVLVPCMAYTITWAGYYAARQHGPDDKLRRRGKDSETCDVPPFLSACQGNCSSTSVVHKNSDNSIVINGLPAACVAQMSNLTKAQAQETFHGRVSAVNETAIHLSGMPKHFADEIIKNAANVV